MTTTTDTYEWAGGSAAFNTLKKWYLSTNKKVHVVPTSSDNADFAKGGTISGNGSVDQLTIEASVTFSGQITASDANGSIVASGNLTLDGSAVVDVSDIVTGDSTLIFKTGSTVNAGGGTNGIPAGTIGLSIGGGAAKFEDDKIYSTGLIAIGNSVNGVSSSSGNATVTASGGAQINASYTGLGGTGGYSSTDSDSGILILTGADTNWSNTGSSGGDGAQGAILVGVMGTAKLIIEDGASLSDNTFGDIGGAASAIGLAEVKGVGSTWFNVDAVYVGDSGHGKLILSSGGSVTSSGGDIGNNEGSVGSTLIESGASWIDNLWLDVGYGGTGTLAIDADGTMDVGADLPLADTAAVLVGYVNGSEGSITVVGKDAQFDVNGQVDLGVDGAGKMTIADGGEVTSGDTSGNTASGVVLGFYSDGVGTLTVTGAESSLTNIGLFEVAAGGHGTMKVLDGAEVTTDINQSLGYDGLYIAGGSGSIGTIDVYDIGSSLTVDTASVIGEGGKGSLDVSNGGDVSIGVSLDAAADTAIYLGLDKGAFGIIDVSGAGSQLTANGEVDDGVSGRGEFTISEGGGMSAAGETLIGDQKGSNGALTVSGSAMVGNTLVQSEFAYGAQLVIGNQGVGSLSVEDGALVINTGTGDIDIGTAKGGRGTVTVDGTGSSLQGSSLTMGQAGSASMTISNGGAFTVSGEALVERTSSITLAGGTLNADELSFAGKGALSGYGTINVPTIDNGSLTATGGTLEMNGTIAGHAVLTVADNSTLQLDDGVSTSAHMNFLGSTDENINFIAPQLVKGEIDDFIAGDTINLGGLTVESSHFSQGASDAKLTLTLSNGDKANLLFAGSSYTKSDFVFNTDAHGGTFITHS